MKAIKYNNQIITLDNVQKAEIYDNGTGSKSNPHDYSIHITTITDDRVFLKIGDVPYEEVERVFDEIFNIIIK